MKKEYFILLLPLFFILHGYTENYPLVGISDALRLLLEYLVIMIVLVGLSFLLFRSWRKTSVFVTIIMAYYFFFGAIHDTIKKIFGHSFPAKYIFILPVSLILLIVLIIFIKRTQRKFDRLTRYLNLLLLVLILFDLGSLIVFKSNQKTAKQSLPVGFVKCDTCTKPDIYLIVADEYAGKKELTDLFNFDNTAFENELGKRGFFLVNSPRSNYNYTPSSMGSLLSMDFLQGITNRSSDLTTRKISFRAINQNALVDILKAEGYTFVNHSLFDFAEIPTSIDNQFLSTRKKLITTQTLSGRLTKDMWFNLITTFKIASARKNYALFQLRTVEKMYDDTKATALEKSDKPRFVYTHLMMPHHPYIFTKNGEMRPVDTILDGNHDRVDLYTEYLQYSNQKFLELIDHILKNSQSPPVILLMSDHGFREFNYPVDSLYRFRTLNSIYLPNKNYTGFYEGMSNVNQFRVLLNSQFGLRLPLLKDSTIVLQE